MFNHPIGSNKKPKSPAAPMAAEPMEGSMEEGDEGMHGPPVEVHHTHEHEMGAHHVHAIHGDGHEQHSDHATADEAIAHHKKLVGGGEGDTGYEEKESEGY